MFIILYQILEGRALSYFNNLRKKAQKPEHDATTPGHTRTARGMDSCIMFFSILTVSSQIMA